MTAISWIPPRSTIGSAATETALEVNAWVSDFFNRMNTLDLIQTSDTGQYVPGTTDCYTSLASNGGELAYQVYRLNDVHSATHPLYIKLHFSAVTGTKTNGFSISGTVTVGTATNGSGDFIGATLSKQVYSGYNVSGAGRMGGNISFACTNSSRGFFALVFNAGGQSPAYDQRYAPFSFCIDRIPNPDGSPSTDGFSLYSTNLTYNSNNPVNNNANSYNNVGVCSQQTLMFEGSKIYSHGYGVPVFGQGAVISPDILVNHFYHTTPLPVRSANVAAIPAGVLGKGVQLSVIPYGSTPVNFISMDYVCAFRTNAIYAMDLVFTFE